MHAFVRSPGPPPPKFRWCERFVWVLFLCLSKRKHLIYYNLVTSPLRNKPFKASQVLSSNDHVLPQDIQMPLMLPLPPSSPPPPENHTPATQLCQIDPALPALHDFSVFLFSTTSTDLTCFTFSMLCASCWTRSPTPPWSNRTPPTVFLCI